MPRGQSHYENFLRLQKKIMQWDITQWEFTLGEGPVYLFIDSFKVFLIKSAVCLMNIIDGTQVFSIGNSFKEYD